MGVKKSLKIKIAKKRKNNIIFPELDVVKQYTRMGMTILPYQYGNIAIIVYPVGCIGTRHISISVQSGLIGFWGYADENNILFPVYNRITYLTDMYPLSYYWDKLSNFEKKKFDYQELNLTLNNKYKYNVWQLELNSKITCKELHNFSKFMLFYAVRNNLLYSIIEYQNYFYNYLCEINNTTTDGETYTYFNRSDFDTKYTTLPSNISFIDNFFFIKGIPWKQNNFLFYVGLQADVENEFIPVVCIKNLDMQQSILSIGVLREYLNINNENFFSWKFEDPRICYNEVVKNRSMPGISECNVYECLFEYKSFYKKTGFNPYCDQVLNYLKKFAHGQFIKFFKQRSYLADLVYFYYKSKLQIQNIKFLSSNVGNNHFLPKFFKVENYGFCKISFEHCSPWRDFYYYRQINLDVAPFIKNGLCESMLILSIDDVDYKTIGEKIDLSENLDLDYISKRHYYCFPSTKTAYTEQGPDTVGIEKALDFYISQNLKTEDLSIDNFFRCYLRKNPEKKKQVEEMKKMVKIYCDLVNQTKFNVLDNVSVFTQDPAIFEQVKDQVTLCCDLLSKFFIDFFGSLGLLNNFLNLKTIKIRWNRKHKMFSFYKK
jgi:hypothetical protein